MPLKTTAAALPCSATLRAEASILRRARSSISVSARLSASPFRLARLSASASLSVRVRSTRRIRSSLSVRATLTASPEVVGVVSARATLTVRATLAPRARRLRELRRPAALIARATIRFRARRWRVPGCRLSLSASLSASIQKTTRAERYDAHGRSLPLRLQLRQTAALTAPLATSISQSLQLAEDASP